MELEMSKKQNYKNIIYLVKLILMCILCISVVFEIILFPKLENLVGCIMMLFSYLVFTKLFLKRLLWLIFRLHL